MLTLLNSLKPDQQRLLFSVLLTFPLGFFNIELNLFDIQALRGLYHFLALLNFERPLFSRVLFFKAFFFTAKLCHI